MTLSLLVDQLLTTDTWTDRHLCFIYKESCEFITLLFYMDNRGFIVFYKLLSILNVIIVVLY